jgi:carboxyl-terminal processing protease
VTARLLLLAALLTAFVSAHAADGARERREDFDAMWRAIDARYAYFDDEGRARWRKARGAWRPRAEAARSREQLAETIERALAALHDDHVSLSERTPRSPRRVPQDSDIWASWREGRATVEAVRYAGDADYAGLRPGDVVARIQGVPIERAVRELASAGDSPPRDPQARDLDWALRHVLAGPRTGAFTLDIVGREPSHIEIERDTHRAAVPPTVVSRRIGEARDIAYIRLRNLDDARAVAELDAALATAGDARALILDLRETLPGRREATTAILARFAQREAPWQIRESRSGKRDADRIVPIPSRAPKVPLVVLADRFTAGESEALVAGLVVTAGARYVGTPMAGLRGELQEVRLPHSGLVVRFPAEKALMPDGTPRESLHPAIEVNLAAPNGGPGDPILYQALKLLEK